MKTKKYAMCVYGLVIKNMEEWALFKKKGFLVRVRVRVKGRRRNTNCRTLPSNHLRPLEYYILYFMILYYT